MDIVSSKTRSRMMSGIRNRNTAPELLLRKRLHGKGYRYRLHSRYLPGRPDLVLERFKTVIFVNGCFWHGHECHLFKWPKTRPEFWRTKILGNRERDKRNVLECQKAEYRTMIVWECALKEKPVSDLDFVATQVEKFLVSDRESGEIPSVAS